jgi:hypothetical protein
MTELSGGKPLLSGQAYGRQMRYPLIRRKVIGLQNELNGRSLPTEIGRLESHAAGSLPHC